MSDHNSYAVFSGNIILQTILASVQDAIISVDAQGQIIQWNAGAAAIFGYKSDEAIGRNIDLIIPKQFSEAHAHGIKRFADTGKRKLLKQGPIEISAVRQDGTEFPIELTLSDWTVDDAIFITSIIRDISDRKANESDLIDAKEQAEIANKAKSNFLANMSHELRTPLNAIIGFSDAMTSGSFGPIENKSHGEYIEHIHDSGSHLLSLINEILDLSKVDSGNLTILEEDVILSDAIIASITLLQTRADIANVKLKNNAANTSIVLRADGMRIKQILLNLLSNAVNFTEPGGCITVDVRICEDGSCEFSIADQGIGMSEDDVQIALEPFGQIDRTLSRNQEGTGLGLPLTKGLVELHGGTLEVESEQDHGTVVTVTLSKERVIQSVS